MIIIVTILAIVLVASIFCNILLYKAGIRHLEDNELMRDWITDFKVDVNDTYDEIKNLDNQNIFEKDDEVGVVFQELLEIISKLKERTQDE